MHATDRLWRLWRPTVACDNKRAWVGRLIEDTVGQRDKLDPAVGRCEPLSQLAILCLLQHAARKDESKRLGRGVDRGVQRNHCLGRRDSKGLRVLTPFFRSEVFKRRIAQNDSHVFKERGESALLEQVGRAETPSIGSRIVGEDERKRRDFACECVELGASNALD